MTRHIYILSLIGLLLPAFAAFGQQSVKVSGYVVDPDNRGVEAANIHLKHSPAGTTTNRNGYYEIALPAGGTDTIVYSMVGYKTVEHPLPGNIQGNSLRISVELQPEVNELGEISVSATRRQTGSMETLDAEKMRLMPDATGGSIESILITMTGVNQSNELSSQYSVRGGNFDENCVYVNNIEIHRPQLIRAGQQEGLSFVNTDMVDHLQFSAGGFEARYGDKMSSVLDITYKKPTSFEANLSASLMGASAYVGTGNSRFTQMHGIRYKTNRYLLSTLDSKGTYDPNFIDYQTFLTWALLPKGRMELSFLGNFSQNSYQYIPTERSTAFGTYQIARNLTTYFDGKEADMFRTAFGALTLTARPNTSVQLDLTASAFRTNESETYDIIGQYMLTDIPQQESQEATQLGVGTYHEHARNRLYMTVWNVAHNGRHRHGAGTLGWGASVQGEVTDDHIGEWEMRDSMGYSLPRRTDALNLYYNLHSSQHLSTLRLQAYVQENYRWNTSAGTVDLTGGLRLHYWDFNHQCTLSPRVSASWFPNHSFGFRAAAGVYAQMPFYKEMRDTLTDQYGETHVTLNRDIRAQRSYQAVVGADYYFRLYGRPFKLTGEAYYKYGTDIISYTVDNVRIRYSGSNDACAHTAGLDLKLYGQLVPGADSWINLSFMQSKENIDGDGRGWISRPNEQRYSFSMFFQDYVPRHPDYRVHLKMIFADGLPFGPPRNVALKSAGRTTAYRRIDIGASRIFSAKTDRFMRRPAARHISQWGVQVELFNLLGIKNIDSYMWITDVYNQQYSVPNYLTGFMLNVKLSVGFR